MFSGEQTLSENSVYLIFLPVWIETFLVYTNLVIPLQRLPLAGVRDHVATQNLYVVCWWSFVSVVLQMAGFIHKTQFFLKQSSGEFVLMKESSTSGRKSTLTSSRRKMGKLEDSAGKCAISSEEAADSEFKDAESSPYVSFIKKYEEENENIGCLSTSHSFSETEYGTSSLAALCKGEILEPALDKSPPVEGRAACDPIKIVNLDNPIEKIAEPKIMPNQNYSNTSKITLKSLDELVGERINDLGDNYDNHNIGNDYPPNHKLTSLRLYRTLPCPRPLNLNNSTSTCVDAVEIPETNPSVDKDGNLLEDKENKSDNAHQNGSMNIKTNFCSQLGNDKSIISDLPSSIEDVLSYRTLILNDKNLNIEDQLTKQIPNSESFIKKLNDPLNATCIEVIADGIKPVATVLTDGGKQLIPTQKSCEKSQSMDGLKQEALSCVSLDNKTESTKTSSNSSSEKSQESDPSTSSISGSLVDLPDLSGSGSYVLLSDFRDDTDEDMKTPKSHVETNEKECAVTSSTMDLTLESYEMILKTPEIKANRKLPPLPPSTAPVLSLGPDLLDSFSSECDETCTVDLINDNFTPNTTPCQRKRLKPNKVLFEAVNSSKNELTLPAVELDKLENELIDSLTTFSSATDIVDDSLTNVLLEYVENEDVSLEDLEKICSGSIGNNKCPSTSPPKIKCNDETIIGNECDFAALEKELRPEKHIRYSDPSKSVIKQNVSVDKVPQELSLDNPTTSVEKENPLKKTVIEESSCLGNKPPKKSKIESSLPINSNLEKSTIDGSLTKKSILRDSPSKKGSVKDSSSNKCSLEDSPSKKTASEDSPSKKIMLENSPSKKSGMLTPLIGSEGELDEEIGDNIWDDACEDVFDDACTALLQIRR
ncbi:hypothetical protein ACHWQZ_G002259 [Mnemiopsis leidyi]